MRGAETKGHRGHPAGDDLAGRVLHGGAVRMAGFAATNLLAAVGSIVLLHHLDPTSFGRYGIVIALMSIVLGVTDAGLNMVGTREVSLREPSDRRDLLATLLGIRVTLAIVGVLVGVALTVVLGYDEVLVRGAFVVGLGVVATAAVSAISLRLIVEMRNTALTAVELVKQVIQLVGVVVLAAAGASLEPFFAVQALVGVGALAALRLIGGRGLLVRPRYDRDEWLHVLRVALPVAVAGVLGVVYLRLLIILASVLTDDLQVGLLVTSARIVEILSGLPLLLIGVVLPVASVAARDNPERLRYLAQRMVEVGVTAGVLFALLLGFGARPLVLLLGGEAYVDAAPVLAIQGFVLLTVFCVQVFFVLLIALHRQADVVRANAIGLAAVLVAGAVLLPWQGALGGAIAAVLADVILVTVMFVQVRRAGVGRHLHLGLLPRVALAAAAGTAAGLLPGLPDWVSAGLAGAAFTLTLIAVRGLPSELVDLVTRTVGRYRTGRG